MAIVQPPRPYEVAQVQPPRLYDVTQGHWVEGSDIETHSIPWQHEVAIQESREIFEALAALRRLWKHVYAPHLWQFTFKMHPIYVFPQFNSSQTLHLLFFMLPWTLNACRDVCYQCHQWVSRDVSFDWSIDWWTSQSGQLSGQSSVKSMSPIPHPRCMVSPSITLPLQEVWDRWLCLALFLYYYLKGTQISRGTGNGHS